MEEFYPREEKQKNRFLNYFFKNQKSIIIWISYFCIIYGIFSFFSSGDFSFTLTLGSLIQMFGFFLLATKIYRTGSVSGLSKNSIICYSVCLVFRNFALLQYNGYLPYDKSGDYIYRVSEFLSLFCCLTVLYLMQFKFRTSYNWDLDLFRWYWFAIPAAILALISHPNLNGCFKGDFPWTFALYLESLSMFSQLDVFMKKGGEIEQFTSHFVGSSGLSRLFHFIFWISTYRELNESELEGKSTALIVGYSGFFVVGLQIIQMALISEYMYHYLKSLRSNVPLQLPTYHQNI